MIFSRIRQFINGNGPTLKKRVIPRDQHTVSRKEISENALKVLYRLNKAGFEAYLVGGGVRDVLLGEHPKDFDVATSARPEEVAKVFRNCRLIGRRFRLAHVLFGSDVVEVATFRGANDDSPQTEHGMVLRDNVYGTLEQDAERRDFTVNALYYNIADFSVVDFTGGLDDLKKRRLRLIGDPEKRFREDPVRMLRAARFAAKLDFDIEKKTREPIPELAGLLHNVSNARLWDESAKLFLSGYGEACFHQLEQLGLFAALFPATSKALKKSPQWQAMFDAALRNTDQRIAEEKGVNPAFLFAVLLWPVLQHNLQKRLDRGQHPAPAMQAAATDVLDEQNRYIAIARRFSLVIREMWSLQHRFESRTPARVDKLYSHPRFRAAFDLLCLRAESEPELKPLADWWQQYQDADESARIELIKSTSQGTKNSNGPRTRRPRKRTARRAPKPST